MSESVQIEMSDINSINDTNDNNNERDINKKLMIDCIIKYVSISIIIIHGLLTGLSCITGLIYLSKGLYISLMIPLASVLSIDILLLILIIIGKKCIKEESRTTYNSRINRLFIYFKVINYGYFILWLSLDAPILAIYSGENKMINILIKYGFISAPITYILLPVICLIVFGCLHKYYSKLYNETNDNSDNNDNDDKEPTCEDRMMEKFKDCDCCVSVMISYFNMIPIGLLLFHIYIFFESLIMGRTNNQGSYLNLYFCYIKIALYIKFLILNNIQNKEIIDV